MNKLWTLIKTDVNVTFGISAMKSRFKSIKNSWQILLFIFVMLSFIPFYIFMVSMLVKYFDIYTQIGQQSYFLFTGIFITQTMVLFFGLIYVMSKYYFSNDLELLVPLPIKPTYIVASKFVSLMISEYLVTLPIILPFIIIYGVKVGVGVVYWLYALLIVLYIPVLPLSIASILVMVFMKFTNLQGKKDLLRIIGGSISIVIILFLQMQLQKLGSDPSGDTNILINLATNSNYLIESYGAMFPHTLWSSLALSNHGLVTGLVNIVLFLIVSDLVFLFMLYISGKIFFSGLIGNSESSGGSRKKTSRKEGSWDFKLRRPYYHIAKKELKMISKVPVYALNSIGGVIIMPVVLLLLPLSDSSGDFEMIRQLLHGVIDIVVLVCIGLMAFLGIVNSIGVTTFSREGDNFWIQLTLPISARDQIIGRTLASLAIQLLGLLILVACLQFVIGLDVVSILLISIFGILSSVPTTLMGMIIDVARPKLNWTNPQQAMKQNINVLIGMAASVVYIGLIVLLVRQIYNSINIVFVYGIIALILILSTIVFYIILERLIVKQFKDIY